MNAPLRALPYHVAVQSDVQPAVLHLASNEVVTSRSGHNRPATPRHAPPRPTTPDHHHHALRHALRQVPPPTLLKDATKSHGSWTYWLQSEGRGLREKFKSTDSRPRASLCGCTAAQPFLIEGPPPGDEVDISGCGGVAVRGNGGRASAAMLPL